jgi:hypothetical protein
MPQNEITQISTDEGKICIYMITKCFYLGVISYKINSATAHMECIIKILNVNTRYIVVLQEYQWAMQDMII